MINKTKSQRILIIDDSPDNIQILMELLKDEYKVIAATDGLKGIALAQREPQPDLILLDIMMPGIDGYEVCKRLKSSELTLNIPVIFISAMSGSEDNYKGLEFGAADYLKKPVLPEITKARIKNHLKLKECEDRIRFLKKNANAETGNIGTNETGALRLLVVEDNEINLEVMTSQLEGMGYEVFQASNGEKALTLLAKNDFDVILTDLDMPVMDGYKLTKQLRKKGSKTPIIAITASDYDLSKKKVIEYGFTDYILKPFSNDTIKRLIQSHV